MPGEGHVFASLLAAIPDQRERQSVFGAAAEMINARAFAAFRGLAARFLDCHRIAGNCKIAPNVALSSDDVEGVVGVDRPDRAERIGPCADEGLRTSARIGGACIEQHKNDGGEKDLKKALCFHVADCVGQKLKVQVQKGAVVYPLGAWSEGNR